ncbi:MAG: caspase family protein [Vicinamibacteria bacterium]
MVDLYTGSYALLIGNSDYQDWSDLRWPAQDVAELASVLEGLGFQTRVETNVTASDFRDVMAEFIATHGQEEGAQLLIYYAGHGHTMTGIGKRELGYIVPTDAADSVTDPAGFRARSISMDNFLTYSREITARHVLFVFDSCFSGTVLRQRGGSTPRVLSHNVTLPVREFLTAGSADEPVPDRSLFKTILVNVLKGVIEEPIRDGYLTGEELGVLMKNEIPVQNPQYGKILDPELNQGDFVFVLKETPVADGPEPVPPRPDARGDALLWQAKGAYTREDYDTARAAFREAADLGSAEAMTFLGFMYFDRRGVPRDFETARTWFEKGAEKGNASAMTNLSYLYSEGLGVPQNYLTAVDWLSRAVQLGDTAAMFNLGTMYLHGKGINRDYGKAFSLFESAALQGDGAAMNSLAVMYMNGRGVSQSNEKALEWHRKAVEAGDVSAMFNLGQILYEGEIVARDYDEARRLFLKAAEAGNASAMNALGRMYREGHGVRRDNEEALRWFQRAADGGNDSAMNNLGYMYENGYGTRRSLKTALDWYRKGADAGNPGALFNLGRFYEEGKGGVRKDRKTAVQLYCKAASLGDEQAIRRLQELGEGPCSSAMRRGNHA